jgi:hypothetical protein
MDRGGEPASGDWRGARLLVGKSLLQGEDGNGGGEGEREPRGKGFVGLGKEASEEGACSVRGFIIALYVAQIMVS